MKIKIGFVVFLIISNGSFFSMQSSLRDSLSAFKNKSKELLDVLKPKSGGTARPSPKDKKQQSNIEDFASIVSESKITPVKFDLKDQKLIKLLKEINELYQPINSNILMFLKNLANFKDFLKIHQNIKLDEIPQVFKNLLDFPLLNKDHVKALSSKLNELTQYGKDNRSTISPNEKLVIKKYLQGISKALENLYTTISTWDTDAYGLMQSTMWPDEYPHVGNQMRTAFDWFRVKVYYPLAHHTKPRRILLPDGGWEQPACSTDQLNCSILDEAIFAF